jgi:TonB family protein
MTAVYWFHPLCWLALSRLRAESERACDDMVLANGHLPSHYAGHLFDLAGNFNSQLAIPMAATSQLESRVKYILDPATNRSPLKLIACVVAVACTALLLVPAATLTLKAQTIGATGASATISGIVFDPSGARVPGAVVTASNTDSGVQQSGPSGPDGRYTFRNLTAGHYSIEVQARGFAKFQINQQAVVSGATLEADAHLRIGSVSEVISVKGQGAPKPAAFVAPAAAPQRIRIGGNVQAATLIRQTRPIFPASLQAQGIEGSVYLRAIISKNGIPESLTLAEPASHQEFADAAIEAVRQWRFQPTLLNGEPVEITTTIQVNFELQ